MTMKAWLVYLTNKPVLHGAGYDDDIAQHYSWDSSSSQPPQPNLAVGDAIVIWDGEILIGTSFIENIVTGTGTKLRYRCPDCKQCKLQNRKNTELKYCPKCKEHGKIPIEESIDVTTYRTYHAPSWIDLVGELSGQQLRTLCCKPKSQQSMRELHWDKFLNALKKDIRQPLARMALSPKKRIPGGYQPRLVKVRKGQQAFRRKLLDLYGETCALSGPSPSQVIDAAHLYSYAKVGKHHELGGLLIRKDLHRLFDLGLITVDPKTLKIKIDAILSDYPAYQSLNETKVCVKLETKTKQWLKLHWDFHKYEPLVSEQKT